MLRADDGREEEEEESGICEVDMDMGEDGSMTCTKHPNYNLNNNNPGGICAVCLQEKLGNLVSSSDAFPPSSTTSSRSESTKTYGHSLSTNNAHHRRPRIPFLSSNKNSNATSLQRSKSTATTSSFPDGQQTRRSFWSFLYYRRSGGGLSSANSINSSNRVGVGVSSGTTPSTTTRTSSVRQVTTIAIAEEEEYEETSPPLRSHTNRAADKVSRSRSVGCGGGGGGSRSFSSGDFFDRLGSCTIRRVESQRQSNVSAASVIVVDQQQQQQHKGIKERVRCGGIFGGFNLTSSSDEAANSGRINTSSSSSIEVEGTGGVQMVHGRSTRSWAWALASPLRAFAKPTTSTPSSSTNNNNSNNNQPPSLLSVSG